MGEPGKEGAARHARERAIAEIAAIGLAAILVGSACLAIDHETGDVVFGYVGMPFLAVGLGTMFVALVFSFAEMLVGGEETDD